MFLTQQSVSHPPSTWAKGTICFPQPEKSSCHFANLQKKGKKKTPSAWLCEKREFAEHFHMFFSPCINFQCCTLSGDLRISPSVNLGDAPMAWKNTVQTYQPTGFVKHWPWAHRHFDEQNKRNQDKHQP